MLRRRFLYIVAAQIKTGRKGFRMSPSLFIAQIRSIEGPDAQHRWNLATDRAERLWVAENQYLQFLRASQSRGELVVIEFDPKMGEVQMAYPVKQDTIATLGTRKPGDDRVLVQALMSPTLYYLSVTHPRYSELYRLLEQAQSQDKLAVLAIRPGGNMVEDVRVP